jgi:NAD dependent epimerase/dehydratase family enzyme
MFNFGSGTVRVLLSGSSGLIGTALAAHLGAGRHSIGRLVRTPSPAGQDTVEWHPDAGHIDAARLEGFDAVVHLAGESIGAGRWTDDRKRAILDSRVARRS